MVTLQNRGCCKFSGKLLLGVQFDFVCSSGLEGPDVINDMIQGGLNQRISNDPAPKGCD